MENNISFYEIIKIILKKIKLIVIISIIITIACMGLYFYSNASKPPLTYDVKIYGIIKNDNLASENNIDNAISTVEDIYKSDAIKLSLEDIDYNLLFNSSYVQGYDIQNLSAKNKANIANKIFNNFEITFNDSSKLFTLELKGDNQTSAEYILNYIFNVGAQYTESYIYNTQIKLISNQTIVVDNKKLYYSINNIMKYIVIFSTVGFFMTCLLYLFIIILTDNVLSISQIRKRYNIEILTILKKKASIEELKSILLYKLQKLNKNTLIFYSSYINNNLNIILKLKSSFERNGKNVALVVTIADSSKFSRISDIFFYISSFNDNEMNEFFDNLAKYDYIFIQADSIINSVITEELILRYKNVVLIEKIGKSKFEQIDRAIEKTMLYDGELLGFIINI